MLTRKAKLAKIAKRFADMRAKYLEKETIKAKEEGRIPRTWDELTEDAIESLRTEVRNKHKGKTK